MFFLLSDVIKATFGTNMTALLMTDTILILLTNISTIANTIITQPALDVNLH